MDRPSFDRFIIAHTRRCGKQCKITYAHGRPLKQQRGRVYLPFVLSRAPRTASPAPVMTAEPGYPRPALRRRVKAKCAGGVGFLIFRRIFGKTASQPLPAARSHTVKQFCRLLSLRHLKMKYAPSPFRGRGGNPGPESCSEHTEPFAERESGRAFYWRVLNRVLGRQRGGGFSPAAGPAPHRCPRRCRGCGLPAPAGRPPHPG